MGVQFQSTLPRRERHSAFAAINPSIVISIHTPTKGATWNNSTHTYTVTAISIHTPTKGATCLNIYKPRKDVNFNPHSHEGSDCRSRTRPTMITVFQSTLPRRERPTVHDTVICIHSYFNPHSHEGSDIVNGVYHFDLLIFQSTLPRRERQTRR